MLNIFSCASWLSVCLLWTSVYLDHLTNFWLFVLMILSCIHCLHILENNPLSVASFANIVSLSVGCILFSLWLFIQKLLSLIRLYLFIFAFISITLGDKSKRKLQLKSESFLPMFSFKSFAVSSLTFSSLICLVLKSVLISFFTCIIAIQFSPHHLLKRLSSLHCIFLPTLS